MAKRSKKKQEPAIQVKVGDHVLLGGTHASYPWHWHSGIVLWIDAPTRTMMVERFTLNGERYVQEARVGDVRAVERDGISLLAIKQAAADGVRELQRAVDEAAQALDSARNALFARLEEMANDGLQVTPPDFAAMEADRLAERAVQERIEEEDGARAAQMQAA